jgi:hypothetical protein
MLRVCGHGDIGRRLPIEGIRDAISWVWNPTAYKAFPAMLSGLENPEACFLSRIKAFFIKHKGYNDLRRVTEGGHDAAAYLYTILIYRDNGSATADDTAKGYMRRVAGGGSTTSRWLSNEGCLPLREKPRVRSTTRLGAFGVNHTAASGTGARQSAVRRHRRRLRCGKRMASNFSVLQRRL